VGQADVLGRRRKSSIALYSIKGANLVLQSQEAYDAYSEKLFLAEPNTAPKLRSTMNNAQYLDNISAPSKKRRAPRRKEDLVEISDDSDEEEDAGHVTTEESKMEVD
jgi:hypothetical protein